MGSPQAIASSAFSSPLCSGGSSDAHTALTDYVVASGRALKDFPFANLFTNSLSSARYSRSSSTSMFCSYESLYIEIYIFVISTDTLIVAVAPKPPVNHLLDDDVEDKEEDELKFRIPQMTTLCKRKFFMFLRDKLRLPDIILMLLFSLSMKAWIIIAMWFLLAPIAQKYDIGPLYIIGTGFLIILINLGRRQQGDV
ncbi:ubiquitin family protein, partial [Zea mays]